MSIVTATKTCVRCGKLFEDEKIHEGYCAALRKPTRCEYCSEESSDYFHFTRCPKRPTTATTTVPATTGFNFSFGAPSTTNNTNKPVFTFGAPSTVNTGDRIDPKTNDREGEKPTKETPMFVFGTAPGVRHLKFLPDNTEKLLENAAKFTDLRNFDCDFHPHLEYLRETESAHQLTPFLKLYMEKTNKPVPKTFHEIRKFFDGIRNWPVDPNTWKISFMHAVAMWHLNCTHGTRARLMGEIAALEEENAEFKRKSRMIEELEYQSQQVFNKYFSGPVPQKKRK